MNPLKFTPVVFSAILLSGCIGGYSSSFQDLDAYMREMRAKPSGSIEPLPDFQPYEAFTYSASSTRSPFEPPVRISNATRESNSKVRPDFERQKQYLEQFEADSFSLVGSISNDDGLWGLIRGAEGIHRVKVGDYLGQNHGRITYIDEEELRMVELIPAGPAFWVERPRTLKIND